MRGIQKKRFVLILSVFFFLIFFSVLGLSFSNITSEVNFNNSETSMNSSIHGFRTPINNSENPMNNSINDSETPANSSIHVFSNETLINNSEIQMNNSINDTKSLILNNKDLPNEKIVTNNLIINNKLVKRFNLSIKKIPTEKKEEIFVNGTNYSFSKLGNNLMVVGKTNASAFRFSIPQGMSLDKVPSKFKNVVKDNKALISKQLGQSTQQKMSRSLVKSLPQNSDKIPVIIKFNGVNLNLKENLKRIAKYKSSLINSFRINSRIKDIGSINSIALSLDKEDLKKISSLNFVKHIYQDATVYALLKDSVPEINGNKVWNLTANEKKINGFNVTIAIIDTGIDYKLNALGGCFGNGCKVKGGYDFVNLDNDPIDDMGHGTHCAGIAAGNGALKGVAPNASLYAYKVLDAYGYGKLSDILLAIERSVDPNQDGDYSDHMDVDSLSLGTRSGDPDDLLSQSVDFAVDNGVSVVIAAGNSGPASQTIGSPGTSREAITVGASCMPNQIGDDYCSSRLADFSSRGPTSVGIKPDVLAPGVSICSLESEKNTLYGTKECFGSGYISMSGTSMATPHVAGAVALLIQAKKWNPKEVKSALMLNSKNFGFSPNSQGTGEIDLLSAYNASFLTEPSSLNFGNVKLNGAYEKTLTITNVKNKTLNLTLNFTGLYLESGDSDEAKYIKANETHLTIPAFESKSIKITVNYTGSKQDFYSGYIELTKGKIVHFLPFSFITSTRLLVRLKGGELYPDFVVLNDELSFKAYASQNYDFKGNFYYFSLDPGNYTVYSIGDFQNPNLEYILAKKVNVKFGELTELNISILDSREFTLRGTDLDNKPLQFLNLNRVLDFYHQNNFYQYVWSTFFQDSWDLFYGLKNSIGSRKIFISNKPDDNLNTDIILGYYGVPQ